MTTRPYLDAVEVASAGAPGRAVAKRTGSVVSPTSGRSAIFKVLRAVLIGCAWIAATSAGALAVIAIGCAVFAFSSGLVVVP